MLKQIVMQLRFLAVHPAAFRRLCVETVFCSNRGKQRSQPPSGGCVLKQYGDSALGSKDRPAAFRRLCVETTGRCCVCIRPCQPPSGGCVLKLNNPSAQGGWDTPAAFRRLCVETIMLSMLLAGAVPAAFRRLCVETCLYEQASE